jgi:hypothetical protein
MGTEKREARREKREKRKEKREAGSEKQNWHRSAVPFLLSPLSFLPFGRLAL